MFLCYYCDLLFEEPEIQVETHGLENPPYEKFLVCPNCKRTQYRYTKPCVECGNYIKNTYAKTSFGWICEDCYIIKSVFEE